RHYASLSLRNLDQFGSRIGGGSASARPAPALVAWLVGDVFHERLRRGTSRSRSVATLRRLRQRHRAGAGEDHWRVAALDRIEPDIRAHLVHRLYPATHVDLGDAG